MRRRLALVLLAALALPQAAAGEPYVTLADWQQGHALLGTTALAMSPLGPRVPLEVDACHRVLLLDLLYDPAELAVGAPDVGEAALAYDWLVQLAQGDEIVEESRVRTSGYGHPVGAPATNGTYELRLSLANGANVSYELRVRGREIPTDPACGGGL